MIEFLKSEHMYHSLLRSVANSLLQLEANVEITLEARDYIFFNVSIMCITVCICFQCNKCILYACPVQMQK